MVDRCARRLIKAAAIAAAGLALAGCAGGGTPSDGDVGSRPDSTDADPWTIVLSDLPIDGAGIEMTMHHAVAPVVVAAKSSLGLELCPIGFGPRMSACLPLTERASPLPTTDGRTHVGFRPRRRTDRHPRRPARPMALR